MFLISQTYSMKNNKKITLEEIGNTMPFSVPENYFDSFAEQFGKEIAPKSVSSQRFIKPWMYAAAIFIGSLVLSPIFYSVYQQNTTTSSDNYESYVLSQVDESALLDYYVDEAGQ